jgi:hypothetical protein
MFETELAAKGELRRLKIKERAQGEAGLNIVDELRIAALECTKRLAPYGKSIYDATEFFLKYLEAGKSELCSALIEAAIFFSPRRSCGANFNLVAPTHLTCQISALEINETLH